MKKNSDKDLNLREAFPPMPEECYSALMTAARSVKEETPVKKTSKRAVLIAAALIVLTMAIALAANELGFSHFMNLISGKLPQAATTQMAKTESKTFEVGPVQVTLRELLADGRVVIMTAQSQADQAIVISGSGDMTDRLPESEAKRLGLPEESSFLDAARNNQLPLYIVTTYLNVDADLIAGEEVMDSFYGEDGAMLQFNILQINPNKADTSLDAVLTVRVREYNPETKEAVEGKDWKVEDKISIPVSPVIAEKSYVPAGEAVLDGYTVKSLKAEQTVAGIYLTTEAEAGPEVKREDIYQTLYAWEYKTADDKPFPDGINMSGFLKDDAWPTVTLHQMIGVGELPDIMTLYGSDGASRIALK